MQRPIRRWRKLRIVMAAVAVACLAVVAWLFITPGRQVQLENNTGGVLRDVVVTLPDREVVLGEVEAGGRRWIEARDVSDIHWRCIKPDGSGADGSFGFTNGEALSRVYLRITPTVAGISYDP